MQNNLILVNIIRYRNLLAFMGVLHDNANRLFITSTVPGDLMMQLKYRPDFEDVKQMYNHFWAGDCLKRPLVYARVPKAGCQAEYQAANQRYSATRYWNAVTRNFDANLRLIEERFDASVLLGEALPYSSPDLGPDQFAAWFGAELHFAETAKETNWVEPIVHDWDSVHPLRHQPQSKAWKTTMDYSRAMAQAAQGKYLVGGCDLHSHADALSALRGPQQFCMDFYDYPDQVTQAMRDLRKAYPAIYESLYQAGDMSRETGTIGSAAFWSPGTFAQIQCDFICMVSPDIFRAFIMPAIEEEAAYLDRCVFHLDGPGALVHLDDLLAIKDIDVIQWVSGAGQPPMHTWVDVLKKCQAAGKGLQIGGPGLNLDRIKALSKELKPNGLWYALDINTVTTEQEARETIHWLEHHT